MTYTDTWLLDEIRAYWVGVVAHHEAQKAALAAQRAEFVADDSVETQAQPVGSPAVATAEGGNRRLSG